MGRMLGVADSGSSQDTVTCNYTASMVTQQIFTENRKSLIVDIRGINRVIGSGGACTVQFFKSASGVAVGSGTLLHSGSYNVVGTADTQQILTLVSNMDSLTLNPGDSIGYVLTGTPTSAVGSFSITVEPI